MEKDIPETVSRRKQYNEKSKERNKKGSISRQKRNAPNRERMEAMQ